MSDRQVRVTFQPAGRTVDVLAGEKVLEAAARAGLTMQTPCGGAGVCGKCRVQVTSGVCPPSEADKAAFTADELSQGWRLACQTAICDQAIIFMPASSLFADSQQIVTAAGTAPLADGRLIDFQPGDVKGACYGVAVDVGTTTLAAALLELAGGKELAVASAVNPQAAFGDDVLSRIKHASAGGLGQLRSAVTTAIDELAGELVAQAGIQRQSICEVTFAGNTTMQHMLCGLDVSSLGHMPFTPARTEALAMKAAELGLAVHPQAAAYVFPCIGGFVGGDTVAGILSTSLAELPGPVLLVDIGTNGEIVLSHEGRMLAASTAAGPAFEGARISIGMRATGGAIEKVAFDGDVHCGVIGGVRPSGLCGSGLIDLAAELLKAGIVTPQGRLLPRAELGANLPASLARRVGMDSSGLTCFTIADEADSRLTITQRDIRELQLAAAAIRAGTNILLRQAGLKAGDLREVLVAGGFGSFIRRSSAQRIGLLPACLDHSKIRFVGNTSLAGAKWALLSAKLRSKAEALARQVRHVELSRDGRFQDEFAEAMIFPACQ